MKKFYGIVLIVCLVTSTVLAQYTTVFEKSAAKSNYPSFLGIGSTERGMAYGKVDGKNKLYIVSRKGTAAIVVLNAATGDSLGTLDITGISGGTFAMNDVEVSEDGVIFVANLTTNASTSAFKMYKYTSETAAPVQVLNYTGTAFRFGDAFTVVGKVSDNSLTIYAAGSASNKVLRMTTTDNAATLNIEEITVSNGNNGNFACVAPKGTGKVGFFINAGGKNVYEFDENGTALDTLSGTIVATGSNSLQYFEKFGKKYLAVYCFGGGNENMRLVDITAGFDNAKLLFVTKPLGAVANGNGAGNVCLNYRADYKSVDLYVLACNNGIAGYRMVETVTLAQAREDLNSDNKPDRLGDTLFVKGVIYTPNYLANSNDLSYYMSDGTAGMNLYINYPSGATPKTLNIADSVTAFGKIAQFRGLTEFDALTEDNIVIIKDSATLPTPVEVTLAQFKATPEAYESKLLLIRNLSKAGTDAWPLVAADANLKVTDGIDTLIYRIDRDTDVDGSPEPTWPRDLMGVITQYTSSSSVYNDGYQLQPRATTDIIAPVPVELLSFNSKVSGNDVKLSWQTATETNNMGFELYRNNVKVKFVPGYGTTSEKKSYNFEDKDLNAGKYSYRLVQVDYSGVKETVGNVEVEVTAAPAVFGLNQNYPNPFNPSTVIAFSIPVDAKVSLKIMNIIGEEVADIVNSNLSSGQHQVTFNASHLNSGIYFYSIQVSGVDGSKYSSTRKMLLIK